MIVKTGTQYDVLGEEETKPRNEPDRKFVPKFVSKSHTSANTNMEYINAIKKYF